MNRTLPQLHSDFLGRITEAVAADPKIVGLLAGGSFVHGGLDEFSDLDFVILVEEGAEAEARASRLAFARSLGSLLNAFGGEHVGEPRLLICLYGSLLLHVDLKIATLADLDDRVERPAILFARDRPSLEARLDRARIAWPDRDPDWFEERIWIWLHYAATKLCRGELFEAIGMLAFLREQVLGPMFHRRAGRPQRGVRRVEALGLDPDGRLGATVARPEAGAVGDALLAATRLYLDLRGDAPPSAATRGMPEALFAFMAEAPEPR
ncbi:MAG TPA: nucleotidyltransferase domain-containing protein [Polyangiaceae bacterium]|nr:nucleotidyltransferase domain-containing protein [Polyangiaceae bacterium]